MAYRYNNVIRGKNMRFFCKRSDGFQEETRVFLAALQCECMVFTEKNKIEEIREIYDKLTGLGKAEGFIPVFIIPSFELLSRRLGENKVGAVLKREGELSVMRERGRRQYKEVILAKIPVKHPWEVFSCLRMNGWSTVKAQESVINLSRKWYLCEGAVPAVIQDGCVEYRLQEIREQANENLYILKRTAYNDKIF